MNEASNSRLDRIEANLEKLTGVVNTLAAAVIGRDDRIEAHDRQIAALIELASKREKAIRWQATSDDPPEAIKRGRTAAPILTSVS